MAGVLLPRKGERSLPLLSAALLLASYPPLHLLLPPFVALVPFALFVRGAPDSGAGALSALRGGLLLGAVYFGALLHWILVALVGVTGLAVLLYLSAVAALAALVGAVGWSLHRLRRGVGVPLWLALPLAWTAGEWVRAHLPGSLAFPWLGLGTSLTGFPDVVGVAELVGSRGVTFWLALSSGLAADALARVREGRRWAVPAACLAVTLAVPAGWGIRRAASLELRDAGRVAVVQTGISRELRAEPRAALDSTMTSLAALTPEAGSGGVDLVVWPETVFPLRLLGREGEEVRGFTRTLSRRARAPVLLGAYGGSSGPGDGRRNSAFLVDSAGPTGFVYHKRFLVPVVERAPLALGGALGGPERWGGLEPGTGWTTGRLPGGLRFGVLVCYESAFPEAARAYARRGADLLVNITNDEWFGGERGYARTTGTWQHPAHVVMRAIENRIGVVRSANGGISMVVDPVGRTHAVAPPYEPATLVATARTADVETLYSRTGDVAGAASAAAALLLLLAGAFGRASKD